MRTSRLALSAAAVAALTLGVAVPASADSLAGVTSLTKPATCFIGGLASGTGVEVTGRLKTVHRTDGRVTGYTCRITDFPRRVTPEENEYEVDFTLPRRGMTRSVICALDDDTFTEDGVLRIAGNGTGYLECSFDTV
ncbi:hypothetical protein [uncultured Pseudokineococcus sp.]|uniref:hypothetical protein n=1 Tax=uncultured Pseudokineococcus sp. TaxID=1642928 RepID=UPI002628B605|nr:hypothetical protein [uncultured Pseudokineococcus sp.]